MSKRNGSLVSPVRIPDHRSDQSKVPTVYFDYVTFPDLVDRPPVIKIGESGDHRKRVKQHSKQAFGIQIAAEHLCVVRGYRADEQQVLRYFSKYLLPGEEETFYTNEELVDYIRWLRDQYFVWVPDCQNCPSIEELDMMGGEAWLPRDDRCKKGPQQVALFEGFGYGPLNLPPRETTPDDFYTSQIIIDAAKEAMGDIDLDPASCAYANKVVGATQYFSLHDDGLTKEWCGRVWLNPPFSQWSNWVPKIVAEWTSGRISSMCVLCATRTLTAQYFSPIHENCTACCILRGRIPFWGGLAGAPDDGHAVFYFGDDVNAFADAFEGIGYVTVRMKSVAV